MLRVGGVLRHAQRPMVGQVEMHLGGSLGARGELEHDPDAVDRVLLPAIQSVSIATGKQARSKRRCVSTICRSLADMVQVYDPATAIVHPEAGPVAWV
ncbi:hypothetical protein ASF30_04945 [Leifsonia sp. Leaf264]|nr:hypothetical protein ASF30_04945 [Leifsonia sp. Leaf264]